jgi:large subunit ribosomal protein L21
MFAIVETGGKQFEVEPGQTLVVERLPYEVGDEVTLDRVLMVSDGEKTTVGKPLVEGARVIARVQAQGRHRKVTSFRYHNKERLRVKRGHRQHFTRLTIDRIEA